MTVRYLNKIKTINDPVYGFITLPGAFFFDVMEHPWFQRLRRIKQLGLTHYVYPSAHHTRFQHALGSMHLMLQAIKTLRSRGADISTEEADGAALAIFLHDIGHGPFSHTLERSIVPGCPHEELSSLFVKAFNDQFNGQLSLALDIFTGTYPRKFLHQLVSSQLDMDRLDYLSRDSFFTGVAEGTINTDRIIHVMTLNKDELEVEPKGIHSIEKFLIARRLMYWQVYLHKAVLAADQMLMSVLRRARFLGESGVTLFSTPALSPFLSEPVPNGCFTANSLWLERFANLDDSDIMASLKSWINHPDPILSRMSENLISRRLIRAEMQHEPFDPGYIESVRRETAKKLKLDPADTGYWVHSDRIDNDAYLPGVDRINIKMGDGRIMDISDASEQLNVTILPSTVSRYVLYHPKEINIY